MASYQILHCKASSSSLREEEQVTIHFKSLTGQESYSQKSTSVFHIVDRVGDILKSFVEEAKRSYSLYFIVHDREI